ncbi:MAG: hypothetical protein RL255_392, partial [Actinomycetota bacterium]
MLSQARMIPVISAPPCNLLQASKKSLFFIAIQSILQFQPSKS